MESLFRPVFISLAREISPGEEGEGKNILSQFLVPKHMKDETTTLVNSSHEVY